METNKQWRQVPFDYELAKKIQSGEVEGRIMTVYGAEAKILYYLKFSKSIAVVVTRPNNVELVDTYTYDGCLIQRDKINCYSSYGYYDYFYQSKYHDDDLCIELPEEPKPKFKKGDIIKVVGGDKEVGCLGSIWAPWYSEQGGVVGQWVNIEHGRLYTEILTENLELASEKEIEIYKNTKVEPKHEFKPFEQVLVRDENGYWIPRLYGKYSGGTEKHYCQDGKGYREILPYEGNEHLLGTTKNPK